MVGTPVFRIVVSRDSMKNATAISQGNRRLLDSAREAGTEPLFVGPGFRGLDELGGIRLHDRLNTKDQLSLIQRRFHPRLLDPICWNPYSSEGNRSCSPEASLHLRIEKEKVYIPANESDDTSRELKYIIS